VSGAVRLWRRAVKQRAVLIPVLIALAVALGWGLSVRRARVSEEARAEALVLLEAARPPLESARAAMYTNAVEPAAMLAAVDVAERTAVRALELAPELALAHYRRGEARELRGDYPGAQECFARAAELDPKFGPARYRLGRVLLWRAYGANIVIWIDEREARRVEAEQLVQQGIREIEAAQESGFDNELHREIASAMLAFLATTRRWSTRSAARASTASARRRGSRSSTGSSASCWEPRRRRRRPSTRRSRSARSSRSRSTAGPRSTTISRPRIQDIDRAIAVSRLRGSVPEPRLLEVRIKDAKGAYDDFDHLIQRGVETRRRVQRPRRVLWS
jgi:hypothetical protein